jgi:hypothetical protein
MAAPPRLPDPMEVRQMPLAELASACQRETSKFQRGEPSRNEFCWEMLRRAICDRDQAAWGAVLAQYRGVVLAWVRQHPASNSSQEGDDYWVNRALERFWMAVGPDRFALFPDLPSLLKYLKMCVHSVLLDEVRARNASRLESLDQLPAASHAESTDIEGLAVGHMTGREIWHTIADALPDESERLLVYLSFALDLRPREIHQLHPERYPSVAEVYRIKRNVLDRLRRSEALQRFVA